MMLPIRPQPSQPQQLPENFEDVLNLIDRLVTICYGAVPDYLLSQEKVTIKEAREFLKQFRDGPENKFWKDP